jgi:hypothetical protein
MVFNPLILFDECVMRKLQLLEEIIIFNKES